MVGLFVGVCRSGEETVAPSTTLPGAVTTTSTTAVTTTTREIARCLIRSPDGLIPGEAAYHAWDPVRAWHRTCVDTSDRHSPWHRPPVLAAGPPNRKGVLPSAATAIFRAQPLQQRERRPSCCSPSCRPAAVGTVGRPAAAQRRRRPPEPSPPSSLRPRPALPRRRSPPPSCPRPRRRRARRRIYGPAARSPRRQLSTCGASGRCAWV